MFIHNIVFVVDNASELLVSLSTGNLEDFYPSAAIASLMKILKDPSLSQHHTMVIQVINTLLIMWFYMTNNNNNVIIIILIVYCCVVFFQALTFIFKSLGIKSVPFLPQVFKYSHMYICTFIIECFMCSLPNMCYVICYRLCLPFLVPSKLVIQISERYNVVHICSNI